MKSELSVAERTLFADKEMASKLAGNCSTQASECEERQRMRAAELLANQETIKLLHDHDCLELCKETVPSMTTDAASGQQMEVLPARHVVCSIDHQVRYTSI